MSGIREQWRVRVARPITAPPMVLGTSVYFVASNVLYRVNVATGAVCWKHPLPLRADETLTELRYLGGEVRATGPNVLVSLAERQQPPQ